MASSQCPSDKKVNFDLYRKEHEPYEHWILRKSFLIYHWDNFDREEILMRNAQLFINIETLGCTYSDVIMQEIAELANQVPEVQKYRKSRQSTLKRTLVGADSAIKLKYKKESPELLQLHQQPEVIAASNQTRINYAELDTAFRNSIESHVEGPQLICLTKQQRLENRRNLLKDVVAFEDLNGVFDLGKTLVFMATIGKFVQSYDDKEGKYFYIFNDELLAEGQGDGKKSAKKIADKALEIILRGYCYTIRSKLTFFSPDDVIKRNNCNKSKTTEQFEKIKEDNLGFRMLQALGWKGSSLGTKNQGIIDPINLSIKIGRNGLGNDNPSFDKKYFEDLLKNFKYNHVEYDLVFSPEFTKEERAQIHQIAMHHNLKTKSYGKNESRHLVISTKICPKFLKQKLLEGNNYLCEKYEIFKPLIDEKK